MKDPKVLVFDIETSPILAHVWGLRDQNIALNQIHTDWSVIAFAAKWLNDSPKEVVYHDNRGQRNPRDDKRLLRHMWKLLDEADIVITQNGARFDGPKLNARFIMHGMKPPSPYKHLDTYQIVKRVAEFTSNKLEYLTDKLCTKYKKLSHKRFPGFSLWTECLDGNIAAWKEMQEYNVHDVLSTEELYLKIQAWAPATMPKPHAPSKLMLRCDTCGKSGFVQKAGVHRKKAGNYQRFHCMSCGVWTLGGKV